MAASHAEGRKARLLRIDRTGFWIESRWHAHARKEGRERKRPRSRVSGRDRPSRIQSRRYSREVVTAGIGDFGAVTARRTRARVESAAEDRWIEVSADVPEPGALRHRVGSDRRRDVVLRLRLAVFAAAEAVARPADCVASACPGQAYVDDRRDHEGTTARTASGTFEGCGEGGTAARFNGKAK